MKASKLIKETDVLGQEKSSSTVIKSKKTSHMTLYVFALIAIAIAILFMAHG